MNTNDDLQKKPANPTKELVKSMVVDAKNFGTPLSPRSKMIHHCGTNFDFTNKNRIVVNDKKRNLRFTAELSGEDFEINFQRNDEVKLMTMIKSDRWKSAIDRIVGQID